ncbi:hypothetical protein JHK82_015119 [Glycine max]|nr:hypothetical protein JHK82_015119 [Glycine max]
MGLITVVKELWRAFFFLCSLQFWRMALLWTFSILYSYYQLFKDSLSHSQYFKPLIPEKCSLFSQKLVSYPRCSPFTTTFRPVCVITGATSGLGLAAAYELSKEGYVVVLVGRSQQLLSETITKIKDRNEHAHLEAFQVDLSSIESVVKFKTSLQQWFLDSDLHCSIQILINNAGILATSPRVTPEGYDQMIGTNYIGAFALTKLLLPLLESSPVSSKIVNVTSFTHRAVTDVQVDEGTVSGERFFRSIQYPCAHIYEYSKLCLILFSYELHRQLCLMGKSHQIFVTYVITNLLTSTYFHFLFLSCSQVLCTAICIEKVWYMLIVNYLLHNCQLCCLKYVHLIASITCPTFMNLITSFRETLEELT